MANEGHLNIMRQGAAVWNQWRRDNPRLHPDLSDAPLSRANLSRTNLTGANLQGANLQEADLRGTTGYSTLLKNADLTRAILHDASFCDSDLSGAILCGTGLLFSKMTNTNFEGAILDNASLNMTNLSNSNFRSASIKSASFVNSNITNSNFTKADLTGADLRMAQLTHAILTRSIFSGTSIGGTHFGSNDLSDVTGLETTFHYGPSVIGVETLYKSQGKIADHFLRGCGVPDGLITFLPSIVEADRPLQFHSCFISYSHTDEDFARRLYSRMRDRKMRVWFAPEEMKGGRQIYEQISSAIQYHDKVLIVLSRHSMSSEWVISEIRRAKRTELEQNRRKLFPIRLVDIQEIQHWVCIDTDSGQDLAIEIRKYFIPDFSNWKDHDSFEGSFVKLLRDLKDQDRNFESGRLAKMTTRGRNKKCHFGYGSNYKKCYSKKTQLEPGLENPR